MIKIKRGLDLPISGNPEQVISPGPKIRSVALLGSDYIGLKPTMQVKVGDSVQAGQVLFTDKKTEGVYYTAPATGTVAAINRGHKRALQSVVIDIKQDQKNPADPRYNFFSDEQLSQLSQQQVIDRLVESGQWTAFRTRPFGKVPAPNTQPHSIFINAMDTQPLAVDPEVVINEKAHLFRAGQKVLKHLTTGHIFLCCAPKTTIPCIEGVIEERFGGPHPAGLVGTHIHYLDPIFGTKTVWYLSYQDVIAIGHLFTTGSIYTERVIALGGPPVLKPRLFRTQLGASLDELVAGQLQIGDNRIISGSILSGRHAYGAYNFLGRYHLQVSALREDRERHLLEYLWLGRRKHSAINIFLAKLLGKQRLSMTTSTNGGNRAMVPIGIYETIMPLDILPTQLLRALIVGDTDSAQALGCMELEEEDLALCTYVCPGKYEYGPILRDNLIRIEQEG